MQYWTIQIKPFPPETRNENVVLNFQTDCIRNNLFGMGWNIDDNTYPAGEPMPDYEEYQQKWLETGSGNVSKTAYHAYQNMGMPCGKVVPDFRCAVGSSRAVFPAAAADHQTNCR